MGNLAGWPYWKVISITGQAGSGTDYQVELKIGDSAGGDFHLEGHCTNFPQDIRITDDDGTTLLDHWVEDLTADPIVVHVEVKDDLGSNQDIRVYYGKSGETTASNGANTFLHFSHFDSDLSDFNTAGTPTIVDSDVVLNDDDKLYPLTANRWSYGTNIAVETRAKITERDAGVIGLFEDSTIDNMCFLYSTDATPPWWVLTNMDSQTAKAGAALINHNVVSDPTAQYRKYRIDWITGTVNYYQDGNLLRSDTNAANIPIVNMGFGLYVWDSSQESTLYLDWMFVRKYNSPEPAFSSAGTEQTPTLVSVFIRHNPALTGGMV